MTSPSVTPPSLSRGIIFALLCGLFAFVVHSLSGPPLSEYFLLTLALAPFVYAPSRRRALIACGVSTLLLCIPALLLQPPAVLPVGLFVLALGRSGIAYGLAWPRALYLELVFSTPALLLALPVLGSSALGDGIAFWLFWLVQSAFVLGRRSDRAQAVDLTDPFERARQAAQRILQQH